MELIRQQIDHMSYFDREDLSLRKEIHDRQHIAAMNPLIGSFSISERNQRHYATFACVMLTAKDLMTIYEGIVEGHMGKFEGKVLAAGRVMTEASITSTRGVAQFLPSAVKFVYNWNMRELSNIYQGLCLSNGGAYTKPMQIIRLWVRGYRVFADRLINLEELDKFHGIIQDVAKHHFQSKEAQKEFGLNHDEMLAQPNIHNPETCAGAAAVLAHQGHGQPVARAGDREEYNSRFLS